MTERRSNADGQPPRLVLVRHAHRDTSQGRLRDNGLSSKGWRQAEAFAAWAVEHLSLDDALWVSSPKRRCIETLEPVARPIRVWASLDEQKRGESDVAFRRRVAVALRGAFRKRVPVVVLCSHGDWLPVAADVLLGRPLDWKKGAWKVVVVKRRAFESAARLVDEGP